MERDLGNQIQQTRLRAPSRLQVSEALDILSRIVQRFIAELHYFEGLLYVFCFLLLVFRLTTD